MKLPEAAVNEFIEIYQRKFGEILDYNVAEIKASSFLSLTTLLIDGPANIGNQNLNIKTKND
jgi:hypothetical protein